MFPYLCAPKSSSLVFFLFTMGEMRNLGDGVVAEMKHRLNQ